MFAIQWSLVLFSLLAGMGGCLLASAAVGTLMGKGSDRVRFVSAITCLVLLVVGGCFSMTHLALPQNVMAAATNIFSFSGISVELILLGVTFVAGVAYAVCVKREAQAGAMKAVAAIGIVAGLMLAFFCGHGYVMPGRPLWQTELLPLAYFGTALASGALLHACLACALGDADDDANVGGMKWYYLAAALVALVSVCAYVAFLAGGGVFAGEAFTYGIVAIVGAIAAALCAIVAALKGQKLPLAAVAVVTAFLSGLFVRMLMWSVSTGYLNLFEIAETTRTWFF